MKTKCSLNHYSRMTDGLDRMIWELNRKIGYFILNLTEDTPDDSMVRRLDTSFVKHELTHAIHQRLRLKKIFRYYACDVEIE